MKNSVLLVLLCLSVSLVAQDNIQVTVPLADDVIHGNYNPNDFTAGITLNPSEFAATINQQVNPDSLKANIIKLATFKNRNTASDTVSQTEGIGAARRWVYSKFQQYAATSPRIIPAYLQFDQDICDVIQHRNILAVVPGTDTTDKSIVVVEGHIDSRCSDGCDIDCIAEGVEDNATGTALTMEIARIMGQYKLKRTLVFMVTIGEEQGLWGAQAFSDYCVDENINVRAVFNNDVIGGIICGETASQPGCSGENDIDSTSVRLFSFGNNSPSKQLARFASLQYREDLLPIVSVPMELRIMSPEDRNGRGGDHIPFRTDGFPAMRYCAANEHGNAAISDDYKDRQHTEDDILGVDTDNDMVIDSFFVDFNYLARNTVINGASASAAANGPLAPTIEVTKLDSTFEVIITPTEEAPLYKIGVRTIENDFDTVISTTELTNIVDWLDGKFVHYISAAAVDENGIESLFSDEQRYFTPVGIEENDRIKERPKGITMLNNRPNPFDEATYLLFDAEQDWVGKTATVRITDLNGRLVKEMNFTLSLGMNEILYRHGYGAVGTYFYNLQVAGVDFGTKSMVFAN